MRLEIAHLRAKLNWDQNDLLSELIKNIQLYSDKLTHDSLNLACERLDDDHLLDLWIQRHQLMGTRYHTLFLKDLKRKHRCTALRSILNRYFTGEEGEKPIKFMICLIEKWHWYLDNETAKNYIRNLSILNKWVFVNKLHDSSFKCFCELIKDELFDELYKDKPSTCVQHFSQKPIWLIRDVNWHKKWFHARYETEGLFSSPTPEIAEDHFQWYLDLVQEGKIKPDHGCYYPMECYLMGGGRACRRNHGRSISAKRTFKPDIFYKRVERIIGLLDGDWDIVFTYADLINQSLLEKLRFRPELNLKLWNAFAKRMRRVVVEACGSSSPTVDSCGTVSLAKAIGASKKQKIIIGNFGTGQMNQMLAEAPHEIFEELRDMFSEFEGNTKDHVDLLRRYKKQNLPWLQFVKSLETGGGGGKDVIQTITSEICLISLLLKDPRRISSDIPYTWLQGTQGPNIFSSYDELYDDIMKNIDLAGLYDHIIAEDFSDATAKDEIMKAIHVEEDLGEDILKRIARSSASAHYLRSFRNDHEMRAALSFIAELVRSVHPESSLTTYSDWWGCGSSDSKKPFPIRQPSVEETLSMVESMFVFDLKELAERVEAITWLPHESPDSWIINKVVLTQLDPPENLNAKERAEFYISKLVCVGTFANRRISLTPTAIYLITYVFTKYVVPSVSEISLRQRDSTLEFPRIEFSQLTSKDARKHQEALNKFSLLTRLWQNHLAHGDSKWEGCDPPAVEDSGDCLSKHVRSLTGLATRKNEEGWFGPSYYYQQQHTVDLYGPYNLLCLKYPSLQKPDGGRWQPEANYSRALSGQTEGILKSLCELYEKHGCAQLWEIKGGEDCLKSLQALRHRKHEGRSRICKACVKLFLVSTQNFRDSKCLEALCRAGLSKPIYIEAMKCEKLDACKLGAKLRSHGKLLHQIANHHELLKQENRDVEEMSDRTIQTQEIMATHAPPQLGSRVRYGLVLSDSEDWEDLTDLELGLIYEIFCTSRHVPDPDEPGKLISRGMRQLGNFLKLSQLTMLAAKILSLQEHLPLILGHRDDLLQTVTELRLNYLRDMQMAPIGLQALKLVISRLPKERVMPALEVDADLTLVRAQKMKMQCLVELNENWLTDLCLSPPTAENIKRLREIDNPTRVLLTGLYTPELEIPEIQTCLKRLNGIDFNSEMNGCIGDGSGLARLLKPPGRYWNLTPIDRIARIKFARELFIMDNPKIVGAAMKCLEVLQADLHRECDDAKERDDLLHSRKRPDLTYLSRIRLYAKICDQELIEEYVDYMKQHNFCPHSWHTWLFGVIDANFLAGQSNEVHPRCGLQEKLDFGTGIGHVAFGREYSRMAGRVVSQIPEFATFSDDW